MKPRGVLIVGNWKMNHGPRETLAFFDQLRLEAQSGLDANHKQALQQGKLNAAIFTPDVSLQTALQARASLGFPLQIGAQNVHWEKSGAFTGETSGPMLRELGINLALVGHSERRQYFAETNLTVRKRAESLLAQGFTVILCIGETQSERESGKTQAVLDEQLTQGLPAELSSQLILAYEPIWAIGTGLTATPEQAEEAHQMIRRFIWDRFGMEAAGRTSILYGGSVTPQNASSLMACPNIDGALVGGASLKPQNFISLLQAG